MPHRWSSSLLVGCALLVGGYGLLGCARPAPEAAPVMGADRSLIENVRAAGNLTALAAALDASGLAETLAGPGPYTLFAPTDTAFAAVPDSLRARLLAADPARYNTLAYHLVPTALRLPDFDGPPVRTLHGASLRTARSDSVATVNGHPILGAFPAHNGTLYVIGAVLVPPQD